VLAVPRASGSAPFGRMPAVSPGRRAPSRLRQWPRRPHRCRAGRPPRRGVRRRRPGSPASRLIRRTRTAAADVTGTALGVLTSTLGLHGTQHWGL